MLRQSTFAAAAWPGRHARTIAAVVIVVLAPLVALAIAVAGAIVAIGAAAILMVVVALWYPGVLFAAYLVVPPFFKASLQPFFPVDITVVLAVLCVPQVLAVVGDGPRLRARGLVLWTSLAAVVTAGTLWASWPGLAAERAAYWIGLGFLPLLAAFRVARSERHTIHFVRTLLAAGCVVAIAGLFGAGIQDRLEVFGSTTIAVGRAALVVPIIALAFVSEPRALRVAAVAMTPLAIYAALASGSRGPVVAFIGVALIWLLGELVRSRGVSRRVVASLIVAVVSYGVLQLALPGLPAFSVERIATLGSLLGGDVVGLSVETREILFAIAFEAFLQYPILGVGTGGFPLLLPPGLGQYTYPHNVVLQLAAEAGLVGLFVFAALIAGIRARRDLASPLWRTLSLIFWFYLFNGLVSSDMLEHRLMWGSMMLILAAPMVARVDEAPRSTPVVPGAPTHASTADAASVQRTSDSRRS